MTTPKQPTTDLGLAWQAAEAALPEGMHLRLDRSDKRPYRYFAYALGPIGPQVFTTTRGDGRTPTEALRALTEKLADRG